MKTLVIIIVAVVLAQAATITLTIDNEKISRVTAAIEGLYPIPTINTGTEENPVWVPQFTANQWGKECIRRWLIHQVRRWEQKVAQDAIDIQEEEDLVQ